MSNIGVIEPRKDARNISSIFDRHITELKQRVQDAEVDINDWGGTLQRRISEHVKQQKRLLQQYHNDEYNVLCREKNEALQSAHTYQRDDEQLDQLREKCRSLKLELFTIDYDTEPILFVRCLRPSEMAKRSEKERLQNISTSIDHQPMHVSPSVNEPSSSTARAR